MSQRNETAGWQTGLNSRHVGRGFFGTGTQDILGDQYYDAQSNNMEIGLGHDQQTQWNAQRDIYNQAMRGGTSAERGMHLFGNSQIRSLQQNYNQAQGMNYNQAARTQNKGERYAMGDMMGNMAGATERRGQGMYSQGSAMLDQDYGQFQRDQLSLMRQQAAPHEERQSNAMAQKLFSMGQLGTEGGARNIEAFGTGLANADMQRQLSASQFAMERQQADRTQGNSMMNMGVNSMNNAFNQRGMQAANQNSAFDAQMAWDTSQLNRAQQRMGTSQQMFNFGQSQRNIQEQRMGAAQTGMAGLTSDLRESMMAMNQVRNGSGYAGGANTAATTNPWAAAGAELGTSLAGSAIKSLFTPKAPQVQQSYTNMAGGNTAGNTN